MSTFTHKLILKAGREKSLKRRHPWVFSGAVERVQGNPALGETVAVQSRDGEFLAWAGFNPNSQIVGRVWSFDPKAVIDAAFFRQRIAEAVKARPALADTNAWRLVHGESDGLPGLVVDRYDRTLVVQITTAGAEHWRETIADALVEVTGVANILERSDVDVRELEQLPPRVEVLRGNVPDAPFAIRENGLLLGVDLWHGHKTGFYLDQRDNRALTRSLANDAEVLNCFCYTGGMSVSALAGGAARVLSIDSSGPALAIAAENVARNQLPAERAEWMEADVFQALRQLRDRGQRFDLIVLDPPKFAPTAHHAEKATRAYKDINLLGFKLLKPGGHLMTYSCSGGVSADLFQKVVAGAALDAGVDAQILRRLGPGVDHPVSVHFPEGDYLKGLLLRRVG
jgi:23S rRNA (cytosine1962-C5)-methyltransferase